MAGAAQGVPTRISFLSGLVDVKVGEKVRFLGCVKGYNTSSAILTLEHDFPRGNGHKALVIVDLLLETLKSSDTAIGEWVNVMGYVTLSPSDKKITPSATYIQAISLWSAGPLKLDEYEIALTDRLLHTGP